MLPYSHEIYEIIVTRTIMHTVVKIAILHVRKFKVMPAFKKLNDFCKYRHLGISETNMKCVC